MRVSVWFDFFDGLLQCQNTWYMGGKRDNEEWDLSWEHPFPKVSGYKRRNDIKEVDITEFRVYHKLDSWYQPCPPIRLRLQWREYSWHILPHSFNHFTSISTKDPVDVCRMIFCQGRFDKMRMLLVTRQCGEATVVDEIRRRMSTSTHSRKGGWMGRVSSAQIASVTSSEWEERVVCVFSSYFLGARPYHHVFHPFSPSTEGPVWDWMNRVRQVGISTWASKEKP